MILLSTGASLHHMIYQLLLSTLIILFLIDLLMASRSTPITSAILPWSSISIAGKILIRDEDDQCHLTWQSGSSLLMISSRMIGVIELRLDSEILWVEVGLMTLDPLCHTSLIQFFLGQYLDHQDIDLNKSTSINLFCL